MDRQRCRDQRADSGGITPAALAGREAIGYGELVPKLAVSRVLAIVLGFNGVLMTAIFAAISIRAIEIAVHVRERGEE